MNIHAPISAVLILLAGPAFAQAVSQTAPRTSVKQVVKTDGGAAQASKEAAKKDLSRERAAVRAQKAENEAQNSRDRASDAQDQQTNRQKNIRQAVDRYNEANQASQNNLGR